MAIDPEMRAAHRAFKEGVQAVEGAIMDERGQHDHDGAIMSNDIHNNPATSERQRRYMGAALARKRAGKSRKSDPQMSESQLSDYARKGR